MKPVNETLSELVDVADYNRGKVSITEIRCSVNCLNCGHGFSIGGDVSLHEVASQSQE